MKLRFYTILCVGLFLALCLVGSLNVWAMPIQPGFQPTLGSSSRLDEASGSQPIDDASEVNNQDNDETNNGITLNETLLVDNIQRNALVYLPCGYQSEEKALRPLVIVLHGARLSGKIAKSVTRFDELACDKDFVVAYPDALNKQWNDGRRRGDTPSYGVKDTDFVLRLSELLSYKYGIDSTRVYLVGYSSGGMLAQKIALEAPDKIAGIGVVAATMPERLHDDGLKPNYPMPVAILIGTKDQAFPWEGGTTKILGVKVGPVIGVDSLLDFWVAANGGIQTSLESDKTDIKDVDVNTYLTKANVPVTLFTIHEGGHTWPGARVPFTYIPFLGKQVKSLNAAEVIWETLSPYHRDKIMTTKVKQRKLKSVIEPL